MKMSSGISNRLLVVAICSMFSLASACSGDKKAEGDELEVSGEEAAVAPAEGEAPAPAEGEAPAAGKKGKKKKGGTAKKAKKGKKSKKTGG